MDFPKKHRILVWNTNTFVDIYHHILDKESVLAIYPCVTHCTFFSYKKVINHFFFISFVYLFQLRERLRLKGLSLLKSFKLAEPWNTYHIHAEAIVIPNLDACNRLCDHKTVVDKSMSVCRSNHIADKCTCADKRLL